MDKSEKEIIYSWFNPASISASMANEINSPLQFLESNNHFLEGTALELSTIFKLYEKLESYTIAGKNTDTIIKELAEIRKNEDFDFILEQIPVAISQSQDGVKQISKVIKTVKEVSTDDLERATHCSIQSVIDYAVHNSRVSWINSFDIFTEYLGDIDSITNRTKVLALSISKIIETIPEYCGIDSHKKTAVNISVKEIEDRINITIKIQSNLFEKSAIIKPIQIIKSFCAGNTTLDDGNKITINIPINIL
jgi:hypothetical protein